MEKEEEIVYYIIYFILISIRACLITILIKIIIPESLRTNSTIDTLYDLIPCLIFSDDIVSLIFENSRFKMTETILIISLILHNFIKS